MDTEQNFNIFVGAQTGLLKGIFLSKNSLIHKNFNKLQSPKKEEEITAINWYDVHEKQVMIGQRNQTVKIFDTSLNAFTDSSCDPIGNGPIVALHKSNGCIIAGIKSGEIILYSRDNKTVINTTSGTNTTLSCVKKHMSNQNILATGGKENDLKLWDISNYKTPIFSAKNIKPDMVNLRIPVNISGLDFLPDCQTLAVCTRNNYIRLYDPRKQRRPIINFQWRDLPLTCLSKVPYQEKQIVVGSSHGMIGQFDLRRAISKPFRTYRGFAGAVKDIVVHPSEPCMFSVSLDRFLRVHHMKKNILSRKEYLKSRLNCVVVSSNFNVNDIHTTEVQPIKSKSVKPRRAITLEDLARLKMQKNRSSSTLGMKQKELQLKIEDMKRQYSYGFTVEEQEK